MTTFTGNWARTNLVRARYTCIFIFFLAGLTGCSGTLYTIPTPSPKTDISGYKEAYEGILIYPPTNFAEIFWLTAVIENNKVIRTSSGKQPDNKCAIRLQYKLAIRPDLDSAQQLLYKPGLLEKYNFKAELDQGMLKSVGVESTPDRGETLKNLTAAVGEIAKAGIAAVELGETPCTHEPILKFIKKLKDVCPDDKCRWEEYAPK